MSQAFFHLPSKRSCTSLVAKLLKELDELLRTSVRSIEFVELAKHILDYGIRMISSAVPRRFASMKLRHIFQEFIVAKSQSNQARAAC